MLPFVVIIVLFLGYVAARPHNFRYERSGVINASADKIFPYLKDFKMGNEWSPYEKIDRNMKKKYSGPENGIGSVMEFEGNRDVGSGRLEILKEVPNSLVEIKLDLFEPMKGSNLVEYKLTPEGGNTRFS